MSTNHNPKNPRIALSETGFVSSTSRFRRWLNLASTIVVLGSLATLVLGTEQPVAPLYLQNLKAKTFYEQTLQEAPPGDAVESKPAAWGVAVPHHLLAADVIAATLKQLQTQKVDRIFLLSPDHYNLGKTMVTVTDRALETTVGKSEPDLWAVRRLASFQKVKINHAIFPNEHGVGSVLPFLQLLWPHSRIVPILVRADASAADLAELILFLQKEIAKPGTLLVESSDFSHYLTADMAYQKDAETIGVLSGNEPHKILTLTQPGHCDSLNILFLMKTLQQNAGGSIDFFLHKNSQEYTHEPVAETTSYITFFIRNKSFASIPQN